MTYCARCNACIDAEEQRACSACHAPRPAAGWPIDRRLGTTVAGHQYRVLRRLGTGGFGTVYEVETMVGGLRRALKILHAERAMDQTARERFVNEAVVLEQLSHPNVARCYAAGALDGGHELYLLLELVDGVPLAALVSGDGGVGASPLAPVRTLRLAKQIASGLVAVHANGVLHRDLTPRNVLVVGAHSTDERVKLVDFGIAGALDGETRSVERIVGTPQFMAPEQLTPSSELDVRCDLWQLGALIFFMLTGQAPDSEPPEVTSGSRTLDRLVRRLLAPRADNRPRSAADVCEELAAAEHELAPGRERDDARTLLAALCAQPSEDAWATVCRFLLSREDVARLLPAAQRLLAEWPDALRVAPLQWWHATRRGETHVLWPLARALDLSGQGLGDDDARELASVAALSTVTVLSLARNQIGNAGLAALAASTTFSSLRELDLSDNRVSSEGIEALPGTLRQLDTLRLARNGIGARGAHALARAGVRLRQLDLSHNDIKADGAAALAASPHLAGLRRLWLAGNAVGSDGAGAIAVSKTLARLQLLDLAANGIGHGGAAALALSLNGASIEALSLAQNHLGLDGIQLLLSSHRFGALESLDVSSNDIGPQGAMALASSPFVRRVKRLCLTDNRLGDAGLAALLGAPFLSGVRTLGVAQNHVTAGGVALLGGAPPELERLDLSRNPLGRDGLAALCDVLPRLRLRDLLASDCNLPVEAVCALLEAAPPSLARLEVAGNGFGAHWPVVSTPHHVVRLTALDVSRNALSASGLGAVLALPGARSIGELRCESNELADDDAAALSRTLSKLPALSTLHLADNRLGARAIAAIVAAPAGTRLTRLNLALNQLSDAGVAALAQLPGLPSLRALDLEHNQIAFAAARSILQSPGLPLLQSAGFAGNALKTVIDLHSLARRRVELLEQTFAELAVKGADLSERFYARLFERYPAIKPLFAQTAMRRQHHHLTAALTMVIEQLRAPELVEPALAVLAERHIGYGVYPSHYQAVVTTLLDTLREMLAHRWDAELEAAWHDGLDAIAGAMMRAQQAATARSAQARAAATAT